MKFQVYLAGPISGVSYDGATSWRDHITDNIDAAIACYSPLRGKAYLEGHEALPETYDAQLLSTQSAIMTRDHRDVARADAVVAYLKGADKVSIGTVMEVAWAYAYRIPVVAVLEDGNLHDHPMMREALRYGYVLDDLSEVIPVLEQLLLPGRVSLNAPLYPQQSTPIKLVDTPS